jgi:UDP-glucuronate 4-epimerase
MHCTVTGCAGFIGSHLSERLIGAGHEVTGVDCLTPFYARSDKERNLGALGATGGFRFVEADLRSADLGEVLRDAEVVFHLAGQPGVRESWGAGFVDYVGHNVLATQRLLDACLRAPKLRRLIYASSSSIYGNADVHPTSELAMPRPFSPYGVSKLAGEHLVSAYAQNCELPTVALRYFTVYGPRQRPDMAMHRFIEAALEGESAPLFSDGHQVRDFTFVDDVVAANLASAASELGPGTVLNVAGGSHASVNEVIALIAKLTGNHLLVDRQAARAGDVTVTSGNVDKIRRLLDWQPTVALEQGLARQVAWHRQRRAGVCAVTDETVDAFRLRGGTA